MRTIVAVATVIISCTPESRVPRGAMQYVEPTNFASGCSYRDLQKIKQFISVFNLVLPVISLEYEVEAYRKLGREEKADTIARFISQSSY
jgi:hypothetical protein